MMTAFTSHQFKDTEGRPAGGHTFGTGFAIAWQNGPLGRGAERLEPNGAFVETIIGAVVDRIEFYNACGFECDETHDAIHYLRQALDVLHSRTARREAAGTEGTHAGS